MSAPVLGSDDADVVQRPSMTVYAVMIVVACCLPTLLLLNF